MRIAHLSDVHFGRIAHPGIVEALVSEVNTSAVDLVVVSGDLTQRARRHEFAAARAMLDAVEPPVLVVPGNHDVRAWWHNPYERVLRSDKRFRRFISPELTPHVELEDVRVFGLDSSHGLTVKGGRIRSADLRAMTDYFAAQAVGPLRVLVLHHHLVRLLALGRHDVSRGAARALAAATQAGVDLVLCGHLHRSHVHAFVGQTGAQMVIASAGTATSSRGRGVDAARNLYNWIEVEARRFVVRERVFDPVAGMYTDWKETPFERT